MSRFILIAIVGVGKEQAAQGAGLAHVDVQEVGQEHAVYLSCKLTLVFPLFFPYFF